MSVFKNLKVLDFTHAYAGPFCTQILGDFGAQVIKVERIDGGDQARCWAPFKNEYSGYYASFNRGKKSITVDMKSCEGREILRRLIMESDVVCSNFKAGTLEKLGLGYDDIKAERPDIIYTTLTGYGKSGEFSKYAAYDNVIQALSGIMDLNGFPERTPSKVGPAIGDSYSGLILLLGLVIALYYRKKTGKGQHVEATMTGSLYGLLEYPVLEYTAGGNIIHRTGNAIPYSAPDDVYRAKDEYVAVSVKNDEMWEIFCEKLGIGQSDEFSTNEKRLASQGKLREVIEKALSEYTAGEVEEMFSGSIVPVAEVEDIVKALDSAQLKAREMVIDITDPVIGAMKLVGDPIKLSENRQVLDIPSPKLGEHTDEILASVGYSEEEINRLREEKVV